jgi:hypothetical protein
MRERTEIEREIFHARQDLEESLDLLVHKVREQTAVRARASHAVQGAVRSSTLWITAAIVVACGVALVLLRRRYSD